MTEWGAAPHRRERSRPSAGRLAGPPAGGYRVGMQCVRPPGDPPGAVCASGRRMSTPDPPKAYSVQRAPGGAYRGDRGLLGDRLSGCA
jgi:hypothetical protein